MNKTLHKLKVSDRNVGVSVSTLEINPFVTYALSGSNSYLENAYGNAHRARVTTDINVKYALSEDMQLKLSSSFELGTPFDESKFSIVFTHFY